jgi:hypothetical protein
MATPDLTEEERAELVRVLRGAIDGDRFVLSPRVKRLKSVLAKLDPASVKPPVQRHPPPRPSGEPSLFRSEIW